MANPNPLTGKDNPNFHGKKGRNPRKTKIYADFVRDMMSRGSIQSIISEVAHDKDHKHWASLIKDMAAHADPVKTKIEHEGIPGPDQIQIIQVEARKALPELSVTEAPMLEANDQKLLGQ